MTNKAIVYVENSILMHREWFERIEDRLLEHGVATVHCLGLEEARYPDEQFELLSFKDTKEACAGKNVVLIVSDVYMDNPLDGDTLGGLTVVKGLKKTLRDTMPPVLIASTRPETTFKAKLQAQGIKVLGPVKILPNNYKADSHWAMICSTCLQHAGIAESKIEVTVDGDFKEIDGVKLFDVVRIKIDGQGQPVQLQSYSAAALLFQMLARSPGREWQQKELEDAFEREKAQLAQSPNWKFLETDADWKKTLSNRLRQALDSLRDSLPQVIYPMKRGGNTCLAAVTWIEE